MAESKQITIDGVVGTWTPDDDGWEYLGYISELEEGYEYEYESKIGRGWCSTVLSSEEDDEPSNQHKYRRRPRQVWQGAGFYETTVDDEPVGLFFYSRDTHFPYKSKDDGYPNGNLVRLIRRFTDEEIRTIVDNGVWPEEV